MKKEIQYGTQWKNKYLSLFSSPNCVNFGDHSFALFSFQFIYFWSLFFSYHETYKGRNLMNINLLKVKECKISQQHALISLILSSSNKKIFFCRSNDFNSWQFLFKTCYYLCVHSLVWLAKWINRNGRAKQPSNENKNCWVRKCVDKILY